MINRSAVVVAHEPAFVGWLKGHGTSRRSDTEAERGRGKDGHPFPLTLQAPGAPPTQQMPMRCLLYTSPLASLP